MPTETRLSLAPGQNGKEWPPDAAGRNWETVRELGIEDRVFDPGRG